MDVFHLISLQFVLYTLLPIGTAMWDLLFATLLLGWAASIWLRRNLPAGWLGKDIPWFASFVGSHLEPGVTPRDGHMQSRRIAQPGQETRSVPRAGTMADSSSTL